MDFLQGLNPQQREAVCHTEGPLLILAGAGSGKTRVITHRIAHLIAAEGVSGPSVLAVTFTNKAAGEMKERVASLLGLHDQRQTPLISTFHSFCVRMLRRDGDPLAAIRSGFTRNFTIYDADDQLALVKQIYKQIGFDDSFMNHRAALAAISACKNQKETPAELYRATGDPKKAKLAVVWEKYENELYKANALDFDDLLLEAVRLLYHDDATRRAYNQRFQYLMIDEYQDTNRSQYELMRLLTQAHKNICVVGDEDQSIYGWRGADIRNILDFERDYPNAKVIRLEQNYRSTKTILEAASSVVANNTQRKGKWLWTDSNAGEPVGLYEAYDGENEALFIADSIEKLLRRDPEDHVAILYRTNSQSRQIEEALRRYGRKYLVVGGLSFYQRAEIKDIIAYLKVATSPEESISLTRIINTPARGIGKTTVDQIAAYAGQNNIGLWPAIGRMLEEKQFASRAEAALIVFKKIVEDLMDAAREKPIHELLRVILDRTGYQQMLKNDTAPEAETRLENLNELLNAAADSAERGESVTEFLDHAALVAESDDVDEQATVILLTIHNAKGLEFPVVFLAGMEENLFPHSRSIDNENALEEERRLCYVGMTRARKRLFLSWARNRRRWGGGSPEPREPSRFLREVPSHLSERLGVARGQQVDLLSERYEVRETVKKNLYTGKTHNSIESISQFFGARGIQIPQPQAAPPPPVARSVPPPPKPAQKPPGLRFGTVIQHPKYGRGTILRAEGEGDDAKLTINFPGYGLKKLVAKYAGLKIEK